MVIAGALVLGALALSNWWWNQLQFLQPFAPAMETRPGVPAGVFQGHQSQIARNLLAAAKALCFPDVQYETRCGQWTHSGMRHQPLRRGTVLHFLLDRLGNGSQAWLRF